MPTLPLLQTPPDPDAWHEVRAPGGYEAWFFDAENFSAGIRLIGFLGEGWQFGGLYKSRYDRYRKRPTRNPPPIAHDYPAFEFALFKAGVPWSACRFGSAGALQASTNRLDLQLAANQLTSDGTGFHLHLAADPYLHQSEKGDVTAKLLFQPRTSAGADRFSITPAILAGQHAWSLAPFCDVTGDISIGTSAISFKGTGCLEHRYGTAPIAEMVKRGITGRLLTPERGLLFHVLQPASRKLETETRLIELTGSGVSTISQSGKARWPLILPYPSRLSFDKHLDLENPRRLHTTKILCYDAGKTGLKMATCAQMI